MRLQNGNGLIGGFGFKDYETCLRGRIRSVEPNECRILDNENGFSILTQ